MLRLQNIIGQNTLFEYKKNIINNNTFIITLLKCILTIQIICVSNEFIIVIV